MTQYLMFTLVSSDAMASPEAAARLDRSVPTKVAAHCPSVRWLASYELLGPWDYVDLFDAPDYATARRVAQLVRSLGHETAEVWPAVARSRRESMMR